VANIRSLKVFGLKRQEISLEEGIVLSFEYIKRERPFIRQLLFDWETPVLLSKQKFPSISTQM
jgi:hypothetical protein